MTHRNEHDLLGNLEIPGACLWGIHTQRALTNFPLGGCRVPGSLIRALAMVKKASCLANLELGYLPDEVGNAIAHSCDEIIGGELADAFPLPAIQGGAGTSTNMNLNEVLANRALEILGAGHGEYSRIHPLDHVNLHQSTNDVYPTALKVAAILGFRSLSTAVAGLQNAFQKREKAFADIVAMGRTELQPAVPLTLGVQFGAFAEAVARDRWRTFKCEERLRVVNLGGTAVGTGLTAPRSYIFLVIEKLREVTGLGLSRGENTVDQTANADVFVEVSAILKALAVNLIKISDDLRRLHFLGEIRLPPVQAGSSIMPGKINPVIPECVIQAGIQVQANDTIVSACAERGSLQINEFLPLLGMALLGSLELLESVCGMLSRHVDGITADPEVCRAHMDASPTLITAFLPEIGYERATLLLREFQDSGETNLRHFLVVRLGEECVSRVLSPGHLTSLGYRN